MSENRAIDYSWRDKAYMVRIDVDAYPVPEDDFRKYGQLLELVRQRPDLAVILHIRGSDEFEEILLSWTGSRYYFEEKCPMRDFGWTHPLLLACNDLIFDEANALLFSILVEESDDLPFVSTRFHEISSHFYPDGKKNRT